MNLVEKISGRFLVGEGNASAGAFVRIKPEHLMTHDNTAAVIKKFNGLGKTKIANPRQCVFTLDHDIQNTSTINLNKYDSIKQFAEKHGVDFYPAGRGIGHQIMLEEGYAFPGTMVVASDSHSNIYGGIGCLGTPVVRTDAAGIWVSGQTWWQIPKVVKVNLTGRLPPQVSGKDVIIALCGSFNQDEVLNYAVEFSGDGIDHLAIEDRLTIANMTTEWGALSGVFPIDEKVFRWVYDQIERVGSSHPRFNKRRLEFLKNDFPVADTNAKYSKELDLALDSLSPYLAGPNSVKDVVSLRELEKAAISVQKAYLVSCVNSRVSDIAAASKVMKGKKVAPTVEFYIAAASSVVQEESEASGDWQTLINAGAIPLPAGCGPCIGMGEGLLRDGEVGISATNRNFKGRMGSPNAVAYLASPSIVAASAISGKICGPDEIEGVAYEDFIRIGRRMMEMPELSQSIRVINGFPENVEGDLLFCDADNINTDGIYPGKYTYRDEMTPEDMAKVCMENFDSSFCKKVKTGDILVAGYNFGTGSSREQAATSIKYKGISLVVAGSVNATFLRNAINNGLIVISSPSLIEFLRDSFKQNISCYSITGGSCSIDFRNSILKLPNFSQEFPFLPLGEAAQEVIVAGGLEGWIRDRS